MTTPASTPSSPPVGRFTGLFLGLIVFVCLSLIGTAGYLKYELDHAEAILAAPDSAFTTEHGVIAENNVAAQRLAAQNQLQFWAMLLTLISWSSLIIASALAVGIYLSLRDRNSAPLRALAQSIKNMARGDMRTPIWGMERQDMVGELARAVDLARYHFSQLPDMSLLSEQGPVRIRFEGNTRSLFEAMMRVMTKDSEQVRLQATSLTEAVNKQEQAIATISAQVQDILHSILRRGNDGDRQIKQVLNDTLSLAQSLKHAQEHATDQLNRIVPYMQERAQGLTEITQITGKQVSQALQSLMASEMGLKTSAELSKETVQKLSATANDLGERMAGAINLLQASGKVLAETTESTQSRLNEAIERLNKGVDHVVGPAIDAQMVARIDIGVSAVESAQRKLIEQWDSATGQLREEQSKTGQALEQIAAKLAELGQQLGAQPAQPAAAPADQELVQSQLAAFAGQMGGLTEKLTLLAQVMEKMVPAAGNTPALPTDLKEMVRDQWYQMAAQIEASRKDLTQIITEQAERLEALLAKQSGATPALEATLPTDAQQQMEQQTQILTELVATMSILDSHMQQIKSEMKVMRG